MSREKIFKAPFLLLRMVVFCLIALIASAFALENDEKKIDGSVIAGSIDNQFSITVTNPDSIASIKKLSLAIINKPKWITNIRIEADSTGVLGPKTSREFTIKFDVRQDAVSGTIETVTFQVSADSEFIDHPNPEMTVEIVETEVAVSAVTACVLKEGVEDFAIEDAFQYCAPDITEVNEYDQIVVFFTPKRELNESHPEEFQFRVRNPNGKVVAQGRFMGPQSGDEECATCLKFTRPGSPGRFAVKLDLWDSQRLPKDPEMRRHIPGTYVVETIGQTTTSGTGLFGQGQSGHKEEGAWQEEGRFEVKDGNIHFAGFIIEPVNKQSMPPTKWRWNGETHVEKVAVDLEKGKVDLQVSAWWQNTKQQVGGTLGPGDKITKGRTSLTMVFPQTIRPGKVVQQFDRTGPFGYPLEPVAEIDINWTSEGEGSACYVPIFFRPAPIKATISRQIPSEGWLGNTAIDLTLDTAQAFYNKSWIPASNKKSVYRIGVCSRSEPFGFPSRTLPWHLHDPDTLWVFPIKFTLEPLSLSSDVEFYGYGIYRRMPGKYDGPLPEAPLWGKTGLRPAGETGPVAGQAAEGEGGTASGTTGVREEGREKIVDPEKLNPDRRNVAVLIREWISAAEPPENAIEGASFRYEQWGRMVGNTADGAILTATGKPDYALASPEKTVWSIRKKLDSVNHCTLEDYVVSKLKNESLEKCRGRYKAPEAAAVEKLTGLSLSDAKKKLEQVGLKPSLVAGKPALTQRDEGTIASQDPAPGTKLQRGKSVKLEVYGPYNPKVVVPEVAGLAVKDAKAELEAKGLKVNLVASDPAPADNLSFKVKEVEPKAGDAVAPGTEVTVKVYGKYTPPHVTVPNVEGLSFAEAKTLLSRAGLKVSAKAAGPAPSEDKFERVQSQEPTVGAKVNPGSEVTIKVYSRYNVPLAAVPGVEGLSLSDAKARLTQAGLKVSVKSAGPAPSKDKSAVIQSQKPAAGAKVNPDSEIEVRVFEQYVPTQAEQVAGIDCSGYPGSKAYWDNAAGRPLCGCFDGMMWNSEKSRCISADAYAAEQCSRAYSGSIAQGRTPDGKINCVCPQGTVWNNERTQCVRQLSPQEVCARDYPGTIAQGLTADGKINCICPQGTILNNDRTRCIQQSTGGGDKKQQECSWKLTQIQMFMNNYKANPSNTFQKQMAENIAKEASDYGCDQSAINAALGVGGSGGSNEGNDDCPCVDEQGRRYRMALGLNCGQQGAWRDYNCPSSTGGRSQPPAGAATGAGTGSANQNQSECYIEVAENIHKYNFYFVTVWAYETTPGRRHISYRVVPNRDGRYYLGGTVYGPYRSKEDALKKARELCPNGKIVGKGYSY